MDGIKRRKKTEKRIKEDERGKEGKIGIENREKGLEGERKKVVNIFALWVGIVRYKLKRIMQRATRHVPLANVNCLIAVFT